MNKKGVEAVNIEVKKQIMNEIEKRGEMFRQLSPIEYRIRCPICGDSQKDFTDAHCYIKCDYDTSENIKYNCFLCNEGGSVSDWFLRKLGVSKKILKNVKIEVRNTIQSIKTADVDVITGYPIPESPQIKFLERKLGPGLSLEDYDRFKIIWNMDEIAKFISNRRILNTLPSNRDRIQFLSDNKSMLLSRSFIDSKESQWRKINIFSSVTKSFYTIKCTLNIFTDETITVNIAEGILDVISVYKNFNDGVNSVFVAVLGSDYISGVDYIISKGFIGDNIVLKIYIDDNIDRKILISQLKKYKWIFSKILIYKNLKYKDVGTIIDRIKLIEYKV